MKEDLDPSPLPNWRHVARSIIAAANPLALENPGSLPEESKEEFEKRKASAIAKSRLEAASVLKRLAPKHVAMLEKVARTKGLSRAGRRASAAIVAAGLREEKRNALRDQIRARAREARTPRSG